MNSRHRQRKPAAQNPAYRPSDRFFRAIFLRADKGIRRDARSPVVGMDDINVTGIKISVVRTISQSWPNHR